MTNTSDWIRKFADDFIATRSPLSLLKDLDPAFENSCNAVRNPKEATDQRMIFSQRKAHI